MAKLPALQFYVGDWRKDPGVQSLSFHDRGVWFEILCLMHESEQRGQLVLNGKPMTEEQLSRLLGLDKQVLTKTIHALFEAGVCSRCSTSGALICRRMVRDEVIREKRKAAGRLGGNPLLVNQNMDLVNQMDHLLNQKTTYQDNQRSKQNTEDEIEDRKDTGSPTDTGPLKETEKKTGSRNSLFEEFDFEKAFAQFWECYEHKDNKKKARESWEKSLRAIGRKIGFDAASEKLAMAAKDYFRYLKESPSPPLPAHASTWLNGERYETDYQSLLDGDIQRKQSKAASQSQASPVHDESTRIRPQRPRKPQLQ